MNKNLEQDFIKLLEQNQNIVHKICRLYTNNEEAHHDLFQEITIQLWKAYPKFRGDSKFSTWAYRVSLNTAITLYRKKKRSIQTTSLDPSFYKYQNDDYDYEQEEQLKIMYEAIKELNKIDKALVFLYLENKNYNEISSMLGISEVNARVKMNRIKKKLKQTLNP